MRVANLSHRPSYRAQSELEDQASKPDGPGEEEDEKETKNRSLAQIIYAENRVCASSLTGTGEGGGGCADDHVSHYCKLKSLTINYQDLRSFSRFLLAFQSRVDSGISGDDARAFRDLLG